MKKLCTLFLVCALLLSAFCLIAAAEEPTYVFTVKGVNVGITGEDAAVFTTQEAYEAGNPNWAITLVLEVLDNGTLKLKQAPVVGAGAVPADVKIGDGVVALVVHSAGSDISAKDQYANVEGKLVAKEATAGMYIVLDGIDLDAGTGSGSASLYANAPEGTPAGDPSDDPSDKPSSEDPASEDTSSETGTESSEVEPSADPADESSETVTSSQGVSAPETSAPTSANSSDASSNESESPSGVLFIVIIVVAAVVIIGAVVFIVIKRKK